MNVAGARIWVAETRVLRVGVFVRHTVAQRNVRYASQCRVTGRAAPLNGGAARSGALAAPAAQARARSRRPGLPTDCVRGAGGLNLHAGATVASAFSGLGSKSVSFPPASNGRQLQSRARMRGRAARRRAWPRRHRRARSLRRRLRRRLAVHVRHRRVHGHAHGGAAVALGRHHHGHRPHHGHAPHRRAARGGGRRRRAGAAVAARAARARAAGAARGRLAVLGHDVLLRVVVGRGGAGRG
jgi:hypothetical protein